MRILAESEDTLHTGLTVKNISALGMLFFAKKPMELPQIVIQDMVLSIPDKEGKDLLADWQQKKISHGKVARTFHDRQLGISVTGWPSEANARKRMN